MKAISATTVVCLVLIALGCGGGDETSSQSQATAPATTKQQDSSSAATASRKENAESDFEAFEERYREKVVVGDYEQQAPFSGIHGGKGNEKPHFDPPDGPAPEKLLTRELEVGSGPPAQSGDEVRVYYAGAPYGTREARYYGWPPSYPAIVRLGQELWGEAWEESIVGMRVGGLREVIIPSNRLEGAKPLDYVIKLVALKQK